jgi:hypothetical protein
MAVSTDMLSSEMRRGKLVWIMKTEAVVAAAKAYFGCSALTGVELENQPTTACSDGRPASHWEQRLMLGGPFSLLAFSSPFLSFCGSLSSFFSLSLSLCSPQTHTPPLVSLSLSVCP